MRTMIAAALGLMIAVGTASAQAPGDYDPMQPPPPAPTSYVPAYVPPPYSYQAQVTITAEEQELLGEGEISLGRYIGGGVTAAAAGFGIGQIVQGRWSDTGWIFTLGESAAMIAFVRGFAQAMEGCYIDEPCHNGNRGANLMVGGLLAYTGLHVWEIVDAWVVPPKRNKRLHALRARLGQHAPDGAFSSVTPYVSPVHGSATSSGGVAGLGFSF